ncbi:SPW repeat protein [Streptomyces sp. NPDC058307]|uniref:SPW repeat domain-containing protein n=1 Tax=Streptomyces sp. NPDC058307 TaxID=3346439 RepID=UPI0036EA4E3F
MTATHRQDTARSGAAASDQFLRRAQRRQVLGPLVLVAAVVLLVAPWIAGYPDSAEEAQRNELAVGIVLVGSAGLSLLLLALFERRGTTGRSPKGVDTTGDHAGTITRQKGRS